MPEIYHLVVEEKRLNQNRKIQQQVVQVLVVVQTEDQELVQVETQAVVLVQVMEVVQETVREAARMQVQEADQVLAEHQVMAKSQVF